MRRRIAVFTSSRADLGPLGPVIAELDTRDEVDLIVIATGTHLAPNMGGRLGDIALSRGSRLHLVDVALEGTAPDELGEVYARVASGTSRVLAENDIDFLVLLGDRWELLAAAGAALIHGVPIAHLHGGETTEGAIDERIRHGITKLADLHLCATEDSARRIRQLGEEPWRITVTGAPGLDRVPDIVPMSDGELAELIGRPFDRPLGVVVYHPPTVNRTAIAAEARAVVQASVAHLGAAIALFPGADPGSSVVIELLRDTETRCPNFHVVKNLGEDFLRLLATADIMIGNSSSGIIEAASFELPVVDVGDRQLGRVRPRNVIHAGTPPDIEAALLKALDRGFRESLGGLNNPYGDGKAASRIADVLVDIDAERLAHKPLVQSTTPAQSLGSLRIRPQSTIRDAMAAIESGRLQIALVVDEQDFFRGTVSDGDLRRALLSGASLGDPVTAYVMRSPITARPDDSLQTVLDSMQRASVAQVPVVDPEGRLVGMHVMREFIDDLIHPNSPGDAPWVS